MTRVKDIVINAFREIGILNENNFPTYSQGIQAVELYNRIIRNMIGGNAGKRLTNWKISSDLPNLIDNSRIVTDNKSPKTLTLPSNPNDGAQLAVVDPYATLDKYPVTLVANDYPIENQSELVLNKPSSFLHWMYREDLAQWIRLTPLSPEDIQPFPEMYDEMFQIFLGVRLGVRYSQEVSQASLNIFTATMKDFISRYTQKNILHVNPQLAQLINDSGPTDAEFLKGALTW